MFARPPIKFCRNCGHEVRYEIPPDDNRPRAVCPACGTIQYENPLVVVGTVPVWEGAILLCRRNIEPRKGLWTLPAGFMELNETSAEGAARETVEESGAHFELGPLFSVMNVVNAGQVHLFYLAQLTSTEFAPGPESIEARLFREEEIPWDQLAFRTITQALADYFADRAHNGFGQVHTADLR